MQLTYRSPAEARLTLAFADDVEVLSPPEVRAELARATHALTTRYGGATDGV